MSGIYIHVPFCARKCDYCDFYSVVGDLGRNDFSNLINKELLLRKDYLPAGQIDTIYFGGGTPSLLKSHQISEILTAIEKIFTLSSTPEITLEANPDDLNPEYLREIKSTGVNRLSIGIQSFDDKDLKNLGRRHDSKQAISSVEWAQGVGFENISIDLIYGLPYSSSEIWKLNLQKAFGLQVKHLSCYHLIYEDGTPLQRKVLRREVLPVNEEKSVEQFQILQQLARENGFIHYEISNLAIDGFFSRHNSSYWQQISYLGVGPSAHSYNGITREWNPRSIAQWMANLNQSKISVDREVLTENDRLNDYLLTSLRTIWGLNIADFSKQFGENELNRIIRTAQKYLKMGIMEQNVEVLTIKPQHFLISDGIISDFLNV